MRVLYPGFYEITMIGPFDVEEEYDIKGITDG